MMKCQKCHIGQLQTTSAPYIQDFDDKIMVIQKAPTYTCDICGRTEYDPHFLENLDYLLEQLVAGTTVNKKARRQRFLNQDSEWQINRHSR